MYASESQQPATSFVSLYATTFVVGMTMITLGPLLDPIIKDLGVPISQAGLVSVGFSAGMLVGVVCLNFLLARVPVKWALTGAALLQAVGLLAAGTLSQGLWSLVTAYFFVGAGCVFLNSLPGMWITSNVKDRADQAMVILLVFFALGMMVTPVVIGSALGWGVTWRWVFGAEAAISAVLAVFVSCSTVADIHGRQNLRLGRLKEVVGFNPRLYVAVLVASVLYIGSEFTFNVWLAKFEIDVFGVDKSTAGLAVTLFWIGLFLGRLVVIPLTKRFPAGRILAVEAAVWAVFALGVALAVNQEMSMVMAFLSGLGASAGFPLILSFSARFPAWHAGVVFSSIIMAGALGRIVFPYLVGPLAESWGFRPAMGLAFVLSAALSAVSMYVHRASLSPNGQS